MIIVRYGVSPEDIPPVRDGLLGARVWYSDGEAVLVALIHNEVPALA
jgi:hypothetical protein